VDISDSLEQRIYETFMVYDYRNVVDRIGFGMFWNMEGIIIILIKN
jgi:hypothetical protein